MLFTAVGGWRAVFCCDQSHPIRLYKAVTHERWSNCFLNLQEVHFLLHLTWVYSWQDDVVMCKWWLRVCMPLKQFDMSKCGDTWTIVSFVPRPPLFILVWKWKSYEKQEDLGIFITWVTSASCRVGHSYKYVPAQLGMSSLLIKYSLLFYLYIILHDSYSFKIYLWIQFCIWTPTACYLSSHICWPSHVLGIYITQKGGPCL